MDWQDKAMIRIGSDENTQYLIIIRQNHNGLHSHHYRNHHHHHHHKSNNAAFPFEFVAQKKAADAKSQHGSKGHTPIIPIILIILISVPIVANILNNHWKSSPPVSASLLSLLSASSSPCWSHRSSIALSSLSSLYSTSIFTKFNLHQLLQNWDPISWRSLLPES